MKIPYKIFCLFFLLLSIGSEAQTSLHKNNISIGGGQQSYNGDLGNAWFIPGEEWYGFGSIQYSRYLDRSFDISTTITWGDYGHCRDKEDNVYWEDGTEVLNMLTRLTCASVSVRYKFSNGYILKENARVTPFIFLGAGFNNISEQWWRNKTRGRIGNYGSINGGPGLRLNFAKRFNFTYNLGFGYFLSDKIDFRDKGRNDMVMQHNMMLGISF